jgi:hypothetical protein
MLATDRIAWLNPRILTTLAMVFLCGALAGAITMRTTFRDRGPRSSSVYWQDDRTGFSYDTLRKELNLTPQQSERLKVILDDFVKYHQDLEAQIEDVRATGRNRILQMLTPEQRRRFEKLSSRLASQ